MTETEDGCLPQAVIIRPGATEFDRNGIIQGVLDVPLNEDGIAHSERLKDSYWGQRPPGVLYSSPTDPAWQTAEALGAAWRVPVIELAGLRNVDLGLWQGMRWTELWRMHPKLERCWVDCPEAIRPPGGESLGEAHKRVARCLRRPLKRGVSFGIVVPELVASVVKSVITGEALVLARGNQELVPPMEFVPLSRPSVAGKALLLGTV